MSAAKGLLLLVCFFVTWGVFTGINAALLGGLTGLSPGAISLVLSVGIAFLEALGLVELADRIFIRARVVSRIDMGNRDEADGSDQQARGMAGKRDMIEHEETG